MGKIKLENIHILAVLTVCVLFFNISDWGVTETSEARYAEISWEMYKSGDYLHPKLLNIGHYHKPPVTYWITVLAYHIFRPGMFAVRFFLQIAVLIQILLVYKIGQQLFNNKKTAFYAAAIYFSFPAGIIGSRALTTDLYLTTAALGAVYCWMVYQNKSKLVYLYLFYMILGAGFLIKGPVALIVPFTVLIGYKLLTSSKRKNHNLHHTIGASVFVLISVSWFIFLYQENHAFLDYFIFDHTLDRFATNSFGRKKPFWFYLFVVPITSFPWFLMLFKPLVTTRKMKFNKLHFLLLWVFVPLIFFSLSTSKLVLYVLPIYAGIALAAGHIWNVASINHKKWIITSLTFSMVVAIGLLIAPLFDQKIIFNSWMYIVLTGLVLITFYIYQQINHKKIRDLMIVQSLAFISCITVFSTFFMHENPELINDQKNVAEYIQTITDADKVYVYDERLPSLAFHLRQQIISIYDGDKDLKRETQFERDSSWKKYLLTPQELSQELLIHAVLVVEKGDDISDAMAHQLKQFKNRREIDGWVVYH